MSHLWQIISYPFRRGPRRSLAERRPDRGEMGQERGVPLGMEATDLSLIDRISRRNDALERVSAIASDRERSKNFYVGAASTYVEPMPEDETYTTRYHRAYNKKET